MKSFEDPPGLRETRSEEVGEQRRGKWKAVEAKAVEAQTRSEGERVADEVVGEAIAEDDVQGEPMSDADVEGEPVEDVEGEPLKDDVEGEPMEDDVEGEPMEEDDPAGEPMEDDPEGEPMQESDLEDGGAVPTEEPSAPTPAPADKGDDGQQTGAAPLKFSARMGQPRSRPRAVDMFADSGDEAENRG